MTNLLLERLLRCACFTFLAVMLVLVVSACGPGGGGTGTGPTLSFSTTSVVTGADGGVQVPPNPPTGGTAGGAPGGVCGRLDLQLEEGRVRLVTECGSFLFVGGWVVDSSNQVALSGVFENPGAGTSIPATLLLQFGGAPESSPSVAATLSDANGNLLAGPVVLGRSLTVAP